MRGDRDRAGFADLEDAGRLRRPVVPRHVGHSGHLYYLLLRDQGERDGLLESLRLMNIMAPFHYVPLHSSPAGLRYARTHGDLGVTDATSARLVRLPLYNDMIAAIADRVISSICAYLG